MEIGSATVLEIEAPQLGTSLMAARCSATGCKGPVPSELDTEGLCVLHFTLKVEKICNDLRRETAPGTTSRDRQAEITTFIRERGELLARVATGGVYLPDEMKARILTTFLSLINLRENMDRAVARAAARPLGR